MNGVVGDARGHSFKGIRIRQQVGTHGPAYQKRTRARQGFARDWFTRLPEDVEFRRLASLAIDLFRKPSGARPRKRDARSNPTN